MRRCNAAVLTAALLPVGDACNAGSVNSMSWFFSCLALATVVPLVGLSAREIAAIGAAARKQIISDNGFATIYRSWVSFVARKLHLAIIDDRGISRVVTSIVESTATLLIAVSLNIYLIYDNIITSYIYRLQGNRIDWSISDAIIQLCLFIILSVMIWSAFSFTTQLRRNIRDVGVELRRADYIVERTDNTLSVEEQIPVEIVSKYKIIQPDSHIKYPGVQSDEQALAILKDIGIIDADGNSVFRPRIIDKIRDLNFQQLKDLEPK